MKKVLITGACGFIGSAVVRKYSSDINNFVVALDALKYSGFKQHLPITKNNQDRLVFEQADLFKKDMVREVFKKYSGFDTVIHLAAESSVDKSISTYQSFIDSNITGTVNLLDVSKEFNVKLFINTITDEVFGHLHEADDPFVESTPIQPRNIYSASKASQYHFGMAFYNTFDFPIISIMPANNYGPRQLPEKLLPRLIYLIKTGKEIPVYGNGQNIRTWLYVEDTANAISIVESFGIIGMNYTIGSGVEMTNLELINKVSSLMEKEANIVFVQDRLGHDFRYSICDDEIRKCGFENKFSFDDGLKKTIDWYLNHFSWLELQHNKIWK